MAESYLSANQHFVDGPLSINHNMWVYHSSARYTNVTNHNAWLNFSHITRIQLVYVDF